MALTKTWRIVRITAFLLLVCGLHVTAKTVSQTITYAADNVPLQKLFTVIKEQTGVAVFYQDAILQNTSPVSVKAEQTPLLTFLQLILRDQPLSYTIKGETIFISAREKTIQSPIQKAPPVTGIVRGPDGQPIAGANVQIKGASKGVVTDNNGRFTIDAEEGSTIVISNVGYTTKEVKVTGNNIVVVDLAINTNPLDEVQIIAYGQTSQRLSTGNVQTLKAKDIEKQPIGNPILALQGRVPGITIEQQTGFPGSGINVQIQGVITLNSGNQPLYVIDGVPYVSYYQYIGIGSIYGRNGQGDGGFSQGSPLSLINPSEIESISVLKDADATSIYGSRAAAGAILITTKKGKAGKTKIDLNVQNGWGKAVNLINTLSTEQYLAMRKAAYVNDGLVVPDASIPEGDKNSSNYDLTLWDQTRYTDWKKELAGGNAQFTNVHGTVSGGNANTQFLLSGTYNAQGTVFPQSKKMEMMSAHLNVNNVSTNQKFHSSADIKYSVNQNNIINVDFTNAAMGLSPNAPALFNTKGELNWELQSNGFATWANPLAQLNQKTKIISNNLLANVLLSYEVLPGLRLKSALDFTTLERNELGTLPVTTFEPAIQASPDAIYFRSGIFVQATTSSWQTQPQLSYERNILQGKMEILLGGSFYDLKTKAVKLQGLEYTSDLLLESYIAAPVKIASSEINTNYKYAAGFGKLNYNWQDKYIVNINFRKDGSSRFGANNRFHGFGSAGLAWVFSNEELFKNSSKILSFGKLKCSYGTTGNDQIGDYRYLSLFSPVDYIPINYQGSVGFQSNGIPNPNLQWEETRKMSASLELGFLNDRLLISGTYYRNRSSNQLLGYSLPPSVGSNGELIVNFPALLQNSGGEFTLSAVPVKDKMINWTTNINVTIPRNKLVQFPGIEESSYANILEVGKPFVGLLKRYHFLGIDPTSGLYSFQKADGSTTSNPSGIVDQISTLYTSPKIYGGWQNSIIFKNLTLDFLFQYAKQIGPKPNNIGAQPGTFSSGGARGNQPAWIIDYWTKPGDLSMVQRPGLSNSTASPNVRFTQSDGSYVDASYARLKNASVSYQLPRRFLETIHFENARIFVQGQNLLTITNYPIDPETKSIVVLPPLRVITVGFQVTF